MGEIWDEIKKSFIEGFNSAPGPRFGRRARFIASQMLQSGNFSIQEICERTALSLTDVQKLTESLKEEDPGD